MKVKLLAIYKEEEAWLAAGVKLYMERIRHYQSVDLVQIKPPKEAERSRQMAEEARLVLQALQPGDTLVLLDEQGQPFSSVAFAGFLQKQLNSSAKTICFLIGGAYGFDDKLYARAQHRISLSALTFPHQLARLIFTEQLYRAFTILRNEKYHHA